MVLSLDMTNSTNISYKKSGCPNITDSVYGILQKNSKNMMSTTKMDWKYITSSGGLSQSSVLWFLKHVSGETGTQTHSLKYFRDEQ